MFPAALFYGKRRAAICSGAEKRKNAGDKDGQYKAGLFSAVQENAYETGRTGK
jgi:hypothetical protein